MFSSFDLRLEGEVKEIPNGLGVVSGDLSQVDKFTTSLTIVT